VVCGREYHARLVSGRGRASSGGHFTGAQGHRWCQRYWLQHPATVFSYGTREKAGQPEEGLNQLVEAARLVEATQERWAEAEMHRLTLLLSMSKHAEAEHSYGQALSVAQRQSAKFWELRAALSMARLWRDQG
jgi:predicted ATPase